MAQLMARDNFQRSYHDRKKEAEDKILAHLFHLLCIRDSMYSLSSCWIVRGKEGIRHQWLLLVWRIWRHIGLEEDWNKLSQFLVKLFLVLLKCNTDKIIAGMENWETCVRFCFSYFPCCCCQASPRGRVYGSTSATKKSILESSLALRTPQ